MTAADRQRIRERINQEARDQLDAHPRAAACRACRCDINALTRGCRTCARRHARRAHKART